MVHSTRSTAVALRAILFCAALIVLAPSASARQCARCPKGSFKYGPWCVKRGVNCGPRYYNRGWACYKRHTRPRMGPYVQCRRGHERVVTKCFKPCARGYISNLQACINVKDQTKLYIRQPVAPVRRWCDKGYWLHNGWCRTACPAGYSWNGTICWASGCPRGTKNEGRLCRKPTKRCIRKE